MISLKEKYDKINIDFTCLTQSFLTFCQKIFFERLYQQKNIKANIEYIKVDNYLAT